MLIDFKTFKAAVVEEFSSDMAKAIVEDPKILDRVKASSDITELYQSLDDAIGFEHDDNVYLFSYGIKVR